ncbi:MAG: murein biosynthesis integral membrane protein MurJ [Clostridia bacterium]|nr:murein biosynthesis integral membrane protein MurJ [Clostridia bacterium]
MSQKKDRLVSATMSVTLIILFSKGVGFIREMIMANYFGRNWITDAYNSAYSLFYLPILLFSSCITSTLVPLYIKKENALGRNGANKYASNVLNVFALFSLIVSLIMMIFAPQLVNLVYPGFDGETFHLTTYLSRIMYPALIFFVAGIVLSTILNAQEHYIAAQLTGLPLSFALIFAAVFLSDAYGIYAQAWGVFAAGVLQIVILYPTLKKSFRYSFSVRVNDPDFKALMILAVPALLSMAVNELNHMIDRMLASSLNPGDISAMTYAFKLITFMIGVLVVPLTTISFSKMSKEAVKKDASAIIPHIHRSLNLLLFAILPIVMMAAVCSEDIIRLAYGRGQFDEESVRITGVVFMFYVVGVPFFGVRDLLNRVFHSLQDTKTPMIIAAISMAFNIALNLVLRKYMGVNGLAFATAIAALIGVTLLFIRLSGRIKNVFSLTFLKELAKILIASAITLAVSMLLSSVCPVSATMLSTLLRLFVICGVGAIVYLAVCIVLRVSAVKGFVSLLKRR